MRKVQKKGQLTLFIILAILIVSAVLVFFLYVQPNLVTQRSEKLYIESCVQDILEKEVKDLSLSAGLINPKFTYMYQSQNITIACYSDEYLKPCVVQVPFFQQAFEKSLQTRISGKIQECYSNSVDELVNKGYQVKQGKISYDISLDPSGVNVIIDAPLSASTSEGSAQSFKPIKVVYPSQIYNILMLANSVVQFEVSYGDSDSASFQLFYPDISVDKIRASDGMKVYTISDKKDIKFKFASRSYAWPPGYGIN